MSISRRTILSGVAVLPAVAAIAPASVAAAPIEAATTASLIKEYPYRYWTGDYERFGCDFDTLAEAMQHAKANGHYQVLFARQQDIPLRIDAGEIDALFEHMSEAYGEYADPDGDYPFLDVTDEQRDELTAEFNRVFQAWLARHDICVTAWSFAREGQQAFDVPHTDDPAKDAEGEG